MIEAFKLAIASDQDLTHSINALVEKSGMDEEILEDLLREFIQELHDEWSNAIAASTESTLFLAVTQSAVNQLLSQAEELSRWAIRRYRGQYC